MFFGKRNLSATKQLIAKPLENTLDACIQLIGMAVGSKHPSQLNSLSWRVRQAFLAPTLEDALSCR